MFVYPILPEIILFSGALLLLLIDVFFGKNKEEFFRISYILSLIFSITTLAFIAKSSIITGQFFTQMIMLNTFTSFVKFISVILLIMVIILSLNFLAKEEKISAEFLALMMMSTVGGMMLISANDFISFYLSLELQSLPLYLLAAINRDSQQSSESGIKYFILGSVASGLLLLGISIFYGFSGTTNFEAAIALYSSSPVPPAVVLGFVLIIVAMFFKISAAPFHMWTPDVYQGSHIITTTFFATVVKFSSTLVLVRLFLDLTSGWAGIDKVLIFVALSSIIVGSFGAIKQTNLKRLFAYSSISHIGYILLGLAALNLEGVKSAVLYMVIYATLSMGSFGFLNLFYKIKNRDNLQGDALSDKLYDISSFSGLSKTNPLMALLLSILLFSTAGIPPLAGFFAKFYTIAAITKSGHILVAAIAILFSVVSAFYYLRLIKIMYFDAPSENQVKFIDRINPRFVIAFMAIFNLFFLLFMDYLMMTITTMLGF